MTTQRMRDVSFIVLSLTVLLISVDRLVEKVNQADQPQPQPTRILLTPPDKAWVWTMDGLCPVTPTQADDLAKLLHVTVEVREGQP